MSEFGDLLRQLRVREGFTQEELAKKLGIHRNTVNGWENKGFKPDDDKMKKLIRVLFLQGEDILAFVKARYGYVSAELLLRLGQDPEKLLKTSLPWNVLYARNHFFTGREQLLSTLRNRFTQSNGAGRIHVQALTGLGGVGKTQIAIEYAYQYHAEYSAVLWVRADSRETLIEDFVALAHVLNVSLQNAPDQNLVVSAAKRWLEKEKDWLLVFDNADDLGLLRDFLPTTGKGHIILTTRKQATGRIAASLPVNPMGEEESKQLLVRRANLSSEDAALDGDSKEVQDIIKALGGLPLALVQAGAYIDKNKCGLSGYWERYTEHPTDMFGGHDTKPDDYPYTVATTWELSFKQVEQANRAAADLLRLCAFLHPDAIPEAIITGGADYLGPELEPIVTDSVLLDKAIGTLLSYSLINRIGGKKLLNLHRLVQDVIKISLSKEAQKEWAERAILAVNHAFSSGEKWQQRQPYLPHAQVSMALIDQWKISSLAAMQLLYQVGCHFMEIGNYYDADLPLARVQDLCEQTLGPEHLDTILCQSKKAELLYYQAKYPEAIELAERVLALREQMLGPKHPDIAQSLNDLGLFYKTQGDYLRAESLLTRAVAMREYILWPEHPDIAESLDNLASLYTMQKKYFRAEELLKRSLYIHQKAKGDTDSIVAFDLLHLAQLYSDQEAYEQAEPFIEQALEIREKALGSDHPDVAECLNSLALLSFNQGDYARAEQHCNRALDIRRLMFGDKHPAVATSWNVLGLICRAKKEYAQAEKHYLKALAIRERVWGARHPNLLLVLTDLLALYKDMQNYKQGDKYYERALDICTQWPDRLNPDAIRVLEDYARWRQSMGEEGEEAM